MWRAEVGGEPGLIYRMKCRMKSVYCLDGDEEGDHEERAAPVKTFTTHDDKRTATGYSIP